MFIQACSRGREPRHPAVHRCRRRSDAEGARPPRLADFARCSIVHFRELARGDSRRVLSHFGLSHFRRRLSFDASRSTPLVRSPSCLESAPGHDDRRLRFTRWHAPRRARPPPGSSAACLLLHVARSRQVPFRSLRPSPLIIGGIARAPYKRDRTVYVQRRGASGEAPLLRRAMQGSASSPRRRQHARASARRRHSSCQSGASVVRTRSGSARRAFAARSELGYPWAELRDCSTLPR